MGLGKATSQSDASDKMHPTIIYIAGYGRSGSTLLDILLGAAPDIDGLGEVSRCFSFWAGYGCYGDENPTILQDEFWENVRSTYLSNIHKEAGDFGTHEDAFKAAQLVQEKVESISALPRVMLNNKGLVFRQYQMHQHALLDALKEHSGMQTIVDSSKTAWGAAWRPVALHKSGFDVKVIHLVRDGRAVMWSMVRGDNVKMELGDKDVALPFARLRAILGWTTANACAHSVSWLLPKRSVIRVRYDDLVTDYAAVLRSISEHIEADLSRPISMLNKHEAIYAGQQVGGNRMRLRGVEHLKIDDAWKTKLSRQSKLLYWVFCGIQHVLFYRK